MFSVGLKSAILTIERPQKYVLGRTATGFGPQHISAAAFNVITVIIIIIIIIITAIQDQVILTRNYKKYILKQPGTDGLCRRCGKQSETIQYITASCEQLAPTDYVKRHDGLAKIIHQKLAEAAEFIDNKSLHYKFTPANVLENKSFKLY